MQKTFSIYLDLVRFGSAFLVFYYHSAVPGFLAWLPWVDVGHHAVIVFFVLSGLVISHAVENGDRSVDRYIVSRVSRVYVVSLPVLLLSVLLYFSGRAADPDVYEHAGPSVATFQEGIGSFISNLLFQNEVWRLDVGTFANTPIWSLCYEVWYYAIFGVIAFGAKSIKWKLVALLLAAAGPAIALLFPIWLLGRWVYLFIRKRELHIAASIACFFSPIVFYLLMYFQNGFDALTRATGAEVGSTLHQWLGWSHQFAGDYLVGLLVAAHFIGASGLLRRIPTIFDKVEGPVRWLAAHTFTLYLLHFPLMHFYAAIFKHDPKSVWAGLLMWGAVLCVIWLVSRITEEQRPAVRRAMAEYLAFMRSWKRRRHA